MMAGFKSVVTGRSLLASLLAGWEDKKKRPDCTCLRDHSEGGNSKGTPA